MMTGAMIFFQCTGIAPPFVCVVSRYNGFISIILVLQDFGKKNMAVPGTFWCNFFQIIGNYFGPPVCWWNCIYYLKKQIILQYKNNKQIIISYFQKSIDKIGRIEYTKTNKRNEIKTRRYGPPETGLWFSIWFHIICENSE